MLDSKKIGIIREKMINGLARKLIDESHDSALGANIVFSKTTELEQSEIDKLSFEIEVNSAISLLTTIFCTGHGVEDKEDEAVQYLIEDIHEALASFTKRLVERN